MKTSAQKTIDESTYRRIHFTKIQVGDVLYQMASASGGTPTKLGLVKEIAVDRGGTKHVTLRDGTTLTRRGWQSRRLWAASAE